MEDTTVPRTLAAAGQVPDPVGRAGAQQPELPLDEPVPYALTARARRAVADDALPALRLVAGQGGAMPVDLDVVDDTLRVRARALHRAGLGVDEVAVELDAEPLHVAAWVAGLSPPTGPGLRVVGVRSRGDRSVTGREPASVADGIGDRRGADAPDADTWDDGLDAGLAEAAARLGAEPALRAGLGLLGGLLRPDRHALLLDGDDPALVAAAWHWVRTTFAFPADGATRVLVAHAPQEAGDRLARQLAQQLGVDVSAVATTRDPDVAVGRPRVRVRRADAALAARVAGWRRLLLAELSGHPALGADAGPGGSSG
jgi:hypothetical protein